MKHTVMQALKHDFRKLPTFYYLSVGRCLSLTSSFKQNVTETHQSDELGEHIPEHGKSIEEEEASDRCVVLVLKRNAVSELVSVLSEDIFLNLKFTVSYSKGILTDGIH